MKCVIKLKHNDEKYIRLFSLLETCLSCNAIIDFSENCVTVSVWLCVDFK